MRDIIETMIVIGRFFPAHRYIKEHIVVQVLIEHGGDAPEVFMPGKIHPQYRILRDFDVAFGKIL
jgi:hypothetical protein